MRRLNWDYVIIGAGSSGCAVANELSRSGRERVLVLEAGRLDRSIAIRVPCGAWICDMSQFDWDYHSAPDQTRNGRSERWTCGQVVGGGSSINGTIYVRGSARDYDRWLTMGNSGWGADSVMPIFKSIERCDDRSIVDANGVRGRQGALHVRMVREPHPVSEAFVAAAQSAGYPFNPDYNGIAQEGVGYTQYTQHRGLRCSAADAFLKPARDRKNLQVLTGARVQRLHVKGPGVHSVEYERQGARHEACARHVILCGGAINTPRLLMLSGIGDPPELAALGIEPVLARSAVGRGLREHSMINLVYRVNVPTYSPADGLPQKARLLWKYLLEREGPIAAAFEATAFLRTASSQPEPDMQVDLAPIALDHKCGDAKTFGRMLPYPAVTVSIKNSHPVSRGSVRLASNDPRAAPLIDPRLLADEEDVSTLARGIAMVRRIMAQPAMAEFAANEVLPGAASASNDAIEAYIRDHASIVYHFAGTCRMGVDEEAVVTPELQVRGIENLWIADASIMPDLISGNTNAACMMIGTKLGRELAERFA